MHSQQGWKHPPSTGADPQLPWPTKAGQESEQRVLAPHPGVWPNHAHILGTTLNCSPSWVRRRQAPGGSA